MDKFTLFFIEIIIDLPTTFEGELYVIITYLENFRNKALI